MIRIVPRHPDSTMSPGNAVTFDVLGTPEGTQLSAFLGHEHVEYATPLDVADCNGGIEVFPETPGTYILSVCWQSPNGDSGRTEHPFTVGFPRSRNAWGPRQIKMGRTRLWVPSAWEGDHLGHSESELLQAAVAAVEPGAVVYDIGANVGLYATQLLRKTGRAGCVYCFEPNPVCVYLLRTNLRALGALKSTILPVAASDTEGVVDFAINYGNLSLGVTRNAVCHRQKTGHTLSVQMAPLDVIIARHRLEPPGFVKIDIEGSELRALEGMQETLRAAGPTLFMELHGEGLRVAVLRMLEGVGYRAADPLDADAPTGDPDTPMPDAIRHILARPRA